MKKIIYTIIVLLIGVNSLFAKATTKDINNLKLINLTMQQRILSQKITKAYLYVENKLVKDTANRELKQALSEFKQTSVELNKRVKGSKLKQLTKKIDILSKKLTQISQQPLNKKNAQTILSLSEKILTKSEKLLNLLKTKNSIAIIKSGQQRMLTQRIAKYYIAYQAGIKKDSNKRMKESIQLFIKNHQILMQDSHNTPQMKQKLKDVDDLWSMVHKFYANIQNGELPRTVFDTTNSISRQMKELTRLYMTNYTKESKQ